MKNIITKIFIIAIVAFFGSAAYCMEEIQYKGANFGISEDEFIKKFKNDNYICKNSEAINSIRVCETISATYGDIKPKTTMAQFHKNKLYGVNIIINDMDAETPSRINYTKNQLIKSIEEKYEKKLDCKKKSKKIKDYFMNNETCKIQDNKGQQLSISHIYTENAALLSISIHSIEGLKRSNDEYKKNRLSNM